MTFIKDNHRIRKGRTAMKEEGIYNTRGKLKSQSLGTDDDILI